MREESLTALRGHLSALLTAVTVFRDEAANRISALERRVAALEQASTAAAATGRIKRWMTWLGLLASLARLLTQLSPLLTALGAVIWRMLRPY